MHTDAQQASLAGLLFAGLGGALMPAGGPESWLPVIFAVGAVACGCSSLLTGLSACLDARQARKHRAELHRAELGRLAAEARR